MPNDSTERKLAAIVFTDIVGSTKLKNELGDHEAVALIRRHHGFVREALAGFKEGEWDEKSEAAARDFQRDHFLRPDGRLDRDTMALLMSHKPRAGEGRRTCHRLAGAEHGGGHAVAFPRFARDTINKDGQSRAARVSEPPEHRISLC